MSLCRLGRSDLTTAQGCYGGIPCDGRRRVCSTRSTAFRAVKWRSSTNAFGEGSEALAAFGSSCCGDQAGDRIRARLTHWTRLPGHRGCFAGFDVGLSGGVAEGAFPGSALPTNSDRSEEGGSDLECALERLVTAREASNEEAAPPPLRFGFCLLNREPSHLVYSVLKPAAGRGCRRITR
jgi:hypothetical protein